MLLIAVVVVSFALTTLDSATRLLRYNLEEIGATIRFKPLANRYLSSTLAVAAISFFAFYKIEGKSAGLALWQLFGSTNQLLAGLALLVVSLYLIQRRRFALPYLIPMVFMMITTVVAMSNKLRSYAADGNTAPFFRSANKCFIETFSVEIDILQKLYAHQILNHLKARYLLAESRKQNLSIMRCRLLDRCEDIDRRHRK